MIDRLSLPQSWVCMRWPFLSFSKKKRERQREREGERERGLKLERNKDLLEDVPNVGTHEMVEKHKEIFGVWCVGQNRRGQHVL